MRPATQPLREFSHKHFVKILKEFLYTPILVLFSNELHRFPLPASARHFVLAYSIALVSTVPGRETFPGHERLPGAGRLHEAFVDTRNFCTSRRCAVLFALAMLDFLSPASLARQAPVNFEAKEHAKQEILRVPAGTIIPVRLNHTFSSKGAKKGQIITARIMQDVPLPSSRKIPKGSTIAGRVISAEPAEPNRGGKISFVFDELEIHHQKNVVSTNLRAMASFVEVQFAQVPETGLDYGTPDHWATTRQIGGDEVYGKEGVVTDQWSRIVGESTYDGVLVHVRAQPGMKCRGPLDAEDSLQALWVFGSDAYGVYGMTGVQIVHAGRTEPEGVVTLASDKGDLKVPRATGMLLRVLR
jgi:hypothetical protein